MFGILKMLFKPRRSSRVKDTRLHFGLVSKLDSPRCRSGVDDLSSIFTKKKANSMNLKMVFSKAF
jgi:hypothetical protein